MKINKGEIINKFISDNQSDLQNNLLFSGKNNQDIEKNYRDNLDKEFEIDFEGLDLDINYNNRDNINAKKR